MQLTIFYIRRQFRSSSYTWYISLIGVSRAQIFTSCFEQLLLKNSYLRQPFNTSQPFTDKDLDLCNSILQTLTTSMLASATIDTNSRIPRNKILDDHD